MCEEVVGLLDKIIEETALWRTSETADRPGMKLWQSLKQD